MPPIENRLLIAIKFYPRNRRGKWAHKMRKWLHAEKRYLPIQCRPVKYSLVVTNVGDTAFDGALIRNISIAVMGSTINRTIAREFTIGTLNHGQSEEIDIESMQTDLSGQAWISISLVPRNENATITTLQGGVDNDHEPYRVANSWGNTFVIRSMSESNQETSNWLIFILTALTFIEAVWGIKVVLISFLAGFVVVLQYITGAISAIIK